MTKFSIYSKDTISGPFLAQFNHFGAKKSFSQKVQLCYAELHIDF